MSLIPTLIFSIVSANAAPISELPPMPVFQDETPLTMELSAPLQELYKKTDALKNSGATKKTIKLKGWVLGTLRYQAAPGAAKISLPVKVWARGYTSQLPEECQFRKLKLRYDPKMAKGTLFEGFNVVKLATHCGEKKDEDKSSFGRLRNEKSPVREVLVYKILHELGITTMRVRQAVTTYTDPAKLGADKKPVRVTRNAFLLEDDDNLGDRLGATRLIQEMDPEDEGELTEKDWNNDLADLLERVPLARIYFAHLLVGNDDWGLPASGADTTFHQATGQSDLWNTKIAVFPGGGPGKEDLLPIPYDFDLASTVKGSPVVANFGVNPAFLVGTTPFKINTLAAFQRFRTFFSRQLLEETREFYRQKRPAIEKLVATHDFRNDPIGKGLYTKLINAFYEIMNSDLELPVILDQDGISLFDGPSEDQPCEPQGWKDHNSARRGLPIQVLLEDGKPITKNGFIRVRVMDVFRRNYSCGQKDLWVPATTKIGKNYP